MNCKQFHAIIPSFSLPGTSLGTDEVEDYIKHRKNGKSRKESGSKLLKAGVSFKHLKHIEKMVQRAMLRMKALFQEPGSEYIQGIDWCCHVLKQKEPVFSIYQINMFCLTTGINAVFCNRVNILIFRKMKPGIIFSNNMGSPNSSFKNIDSS